MPVSESLRRLLKVRDLEEEQHRAALESALTEEHRLERALAAARLRQRIGRQQIAQASVVPADRIAGLVEQEAGRRAAVLLARAVVEAKRRSAQRRHMYLAKRVERRQAETILQTAEAAAEAEAVRRLQQSVDEWFGQRRHSDRCAWQASRDPVEKHERKDLQDRTEIPEKVPGTNS